MSFVADDAAQPVFPLISRACAVGYVHPYKLYAGAMRVSLRGNVTERDGVLYLPYDEVAEYLDGDRSADCVESDGVRYLSVESAGGTYDAAAGKIVLPRCYRGENLIGADTGYIGFWFENTSYETTLSANTFVGDSRIYTMNCFKAGKGGMHRVLTEELKRYARTDSKLILTFDARLGDMAYDDVYKIFVTLSVNGKSRQRIANITQDWRRFTIEFDLRETEPESIDFVWLKFSNNYPRTNEILFTNISLTLG